jgi:hypothetical protein
MKRLIFAPLRIYANEDHLELPNTRILSHIYTEDQSTTIFPLIKSYLILSLSVLKFISQTFLYIHVLKF